MGARLGAGTTRRIVLGGTVGAGLMAMVLPGGAWALPGLGVLDPGINTRPQLVPPRIHTRRQWKARAPRRRASVLERAPNRIVIHHTETANSDDYSLEHARRLSRSIQRFHMYDQGWDDVGQHLTISRGGHIMEGRNRSLAAILAGRHVVGAQARGHNRHTIGIENEGTYHTAPVPAQLWSSLVVTCTWLCAMYELDPHRVIVGHRDLSATDCPGDVLYARLPELRRSVADRLSAHRLASDSGARADS